ncbi:cellulase family glycosylhydrolase [Pumilibacter intestinalis]|uniref:cellulase family glycosylhydrolase n=1 Tax=Pumilibacter intestinalis TaxID=2941511 RepID=UPI002040AD3E|nr:cellulase family glycosylhydrolase [Pumilibacter intestinalis]
MKKTIGLLLALVTMFSLCACDTSNGESNDVTVPEKLEHIGLYLAEDGTMMKDGKEFYGLGLNWYAMLNRVYLYDKWNPKNSLDAMEILAEYDVRVIRFNISGYTANDWEYVIKKEDKYFEVLDVLADKAAELGIGLMPSFFWAITAVTNYFGEPWQAAMRTPESKSAKYMNEFVTKVVSRYAEHPAFYAWEFANELNLSCDLPNVADGDNKVTTESYLNAAKMFTQTVRENDPYNRIIGTGDAIMRGRQYQLYKTGGWGTSNDTQEEADEILDIINEDFTAVSTHAYGDGHANIDEHPESLTSDRGIFSDWDGLMDYLIGQGKRMKKAPYLGEAGAGIAGNRSPESCLLSFEEICKSAVKKDFPLTLFWNYDDRAIFNPDNPNVSAGATEWSFSHTWVKGKGVLEFIKKYNAEFDKKHAEAV